VDDPLFYIGMLVLGSAVGFVSNALGLGGGILMVPAFVMCVPGMDPHTAKGTSLFIIIFVGAVNTWRLGASGKPRHWKVGALVAAGAVSGAYLGAWSTEFVSGRTITIIVAACAAAMALRSFFLEPRGRTAAEVRTRPAAAAAIGGVTGLVSGATGIGGGGVLVPLALFTGIATNEGVVALSNMVMVATCTAGVIPHFLAETNHALPHTYGQVNVAIAPLVLAGAQLAGPLGRWCNTRLTLPRRRVAMGTVLLGIAGTLTYRALGL